MDPDSNRLRIQIKQEFAENTFDDDDHDLAITASNGGPEIGAAGGGGGRRMGGRGRASEGRGPGRGEGGEAGSNSDEFDFGMRRSWFDCPAYIDGIQIRVVNEADQGLLLEFDLVGVQSPIANALRRVLIAEVPSMAIEKVYLYQNTSCIQDEVLCHRLGLLPVYADPGAFRFPRQPFTAAAAAFASATDRDQIVAEYPEGEPAGDPMENLVFEIRVTCPSSALSRPGGGAGPAGGAGVADTLSSSSGKHHHRSRAGSGAGAAGSSSMAGGPAGSAIRGRAGSGTTRGGGTAAGTPLPGGSGSTPATDAASDLAMTRDPETGNWTLYSRAMRWVPVDDEQQDRFVVDPPRMVHGDIILAKLRAGQEIEARCHCVKGVGRDHAKFSPVATATYRLLPEIRLLADDIDGERATRLQSCFADGVMGICPDTGRVYVKDARRDTSSRNVFRYDDLKNLVEMTKKKDHFIFSVESTGAQTSYQLAMEACAVLQAKATSLRALVQTELRTLE